MRIERSVVCCGDDREHTVSVAVRKSAPDKCHTVEPFKFRAYFRSCHCYIRTVLQRVSAVLLILLLPLHIFSFPMLKSSAGSFGYVMVEAVQIIFYATLFCHVALSFSNALVTLGWLSDIKKKRVIDVIVLVICVIMLIAVSAIITTTHAKMFGQG